MEEYYAGRAHCDECRKLDDLFIVRIPTDRKMRSGQIVYRKKYLCAECKSRHENLEAASRSIGSIALLFKEMLLIDIEQALDVAAPLISLPSTQSLRKKKKKKRQKKRSLLYSTNTSGYRGVAKHRDHWLAKIVHQGVSFSLGVYQTPEEAARAYDREAIRLKGDKAITNFPRETYE